MDCNVLVVKNALSRVLLLRFYFPPIGGSHPPTFVRYYEHEKICIRKKAGEEDIFPSRRDSMTRSVYVQNVSSSGKIE